MLKGVFAAMMTRRRALQREDTPRVFHRTLRGSRYVAGGSGHPIKTFYKAWKSACAQAMNQRSGTLRQLTPNRRRVGIYLDLTRLSGGKARVITIQAEQKIPHRQH
jgi:hypothetical protein